MSVSRSIRDDRNRLFEFAGAPRRVVSLVPSDTLNVAALGCAHLLVGRTDYCELPAEIVSVPSVGGTKNPRIDDVLRLEPDLVLANQEENTRGDLETLAQRGVRVYVAYAAVREAEGARAAAGGRPVRVFCPIWMQPLMTIHGDTFISDMLALSGAENVFGDRTRLYPLAADLGKAPALPPEKVEGRDVRYPRVTLDEVVARAPELVLLPDEPHPFTDADAEVFRSLAIPAAARGAVVTMSGKDLCWYGARSVEGIARVRALVARFAVDR